MGLKRGRTHKKKQRTEAKNYFRIHLTTFQRRYQIKATLLRILIKCLSATWDPKSHAKFYHAMAWWRCRQRFHLRFPPPQPPSTTTMRFSPNFATWINETITAMAQIAAILISSSKLASAIGS